MTNRELTEQREGYQRIELSNGKTITLRCRWLENPQGTDSDLIARIERHLAIKHPGVTWRSIEEMARVV